MRRPGRQPLTHWRLWLSALLTIAASVTAGKSISANTELASDDYTAQVAAAVVAFDYVDIPPDVLATAEILIADSIAVTVGAHHVELLNQMETILEVDGGDSLILHSGNRGTVLEAVYLNSLAANMLDFDDSHIETGHPGASIIQPALVLAARYGKSREELLEAIVAGYEFNIRWARAAFNFPGKLQGPWSSGLLQAYGTAVMAAKLLDLDEGQIRRALFFMAANMPLPVNQKVGILPGQTLSSLKNNYGFAAQGAVLAVLTAQTSAQAEETVLDGDQGLWRMMAVPVFKPEYLLADLGSTWEIKNVQLKPYAACRYMHSALDALLLMQPQVNTETIASIDVYTYDMAFNALANTQPGNLLELQFSLPQIFGMALTGQSLIDIRAADIDNPTAQRIARKVALHRDPQYQQLFTENRLPARVEVRLVDGTVLSQEVLIAKGEADNPMSALEHRKKVLELIGSSPHEQVREYAHQHIKLLEPSS